MNNNDRYMFLKIDESGEAVRVDRPEDAQYKISAVPAWRQGKAVDYDMQVAVNEGRNDFRYLPRNEAPSAVWRFWYIHEEELVAARPQRYSRFPMYSDRRMED